MLGGGASNCQCQTTCNSPPPPMGCFCPSRVMSGCSQVASPTAFQPQVYAPPQSQIPYPAYVAPPQPQPIQPPPVVSQPQRQLVSLPLPPPPPPEPLGYGSQQQYVQSLQQVNLQPPSDLQTEYMNQLLKALDSSTAVATTKEYVGQPVQSPTTTITTTTTNKPINYIPYSAGKAIHTTEIKLIQQPYEENSSSAVQNVVVTTQKSQVQPSVYNHEIHRGEGPNPEINESGYAFTGVSSSLPPITLDYLPTATRAKTEIDTFTADVDKYHKNSGSTVPLPSSTSYGATVAPPTQGSGYARDPRHLEEDRNSSENEIYDELTYEDSAESTSPPPLKIKQKDQTISKCNSAKLKEAMAKKMTLSPAISKQMIYSAAAELYPGRTVNVICSKHSFSYIVVTSPIFCEHRKRPLTCFAFFQP